MFNLEYCRRLVRQSGCPITVDRYPSGQIGFVARPMREGKRHNRSFSTSRYPSEEEALAAAVEFCREVDRGMHADRLLRRERYRIPPEIQPQISHLIKQALEEKLDPVAILRDGIAAELVKRLQRGGLTEDVLGSLLTAAGLKQKSRAA